MENSLRPSPPHQKTESVFGIISLIFGLLLLILNPPLRAPDEAGHFVRAYQLATQGLQSITEVSFLTPMKDFVADGFSFWFSQADSHSGKKERLRYVPTAIISDLEKYYDSQNTDKSVPAARPQAIMFPLAYFPQAIAIKAGLSFNAPFLVLLYSARLASFLLCLLVTITAIRIMPFGKELMAAANLLPMAVFERSQISTDGLLIASASLVLAVILRLYDQRDKGSTYSLYALVLAGLLGIAICKSTYLCVFAIWLLLLPRDRKMWWVGGLLILPALLVSIGWGHFLSLHDYRIMNGEHAGLLDPTIKYDLLLHSPQDILMRILRTLWRCIFDWTGQMIGVFGFMDVILPLPLRFLGFFWLVGLVWVSRQAPRHLNIWQSSLLISLFWLQVFLVLLTIFLIWADPASPYIGGIQGRYFLPLLPCLLVGFSQVIPRTGIRVPQEKMAMFTFLPASFFLVCAALTIALQEWSF